MRNRWLKPKQVAALLQVDDTRTVVGWCRDPEHPLRGVELARNVWRIDPASLAALLGITEGELQERLAQLNGGAQDGTDAGAEGGPPAGAGRE